MATRGKGRKPAIDPRSLAPLTTTIIEQVVAYARYFAEKRDPRVIVLAFLFVVVSIAPALFIDAARIPLAPIMRGARR